MSYAAKSILVKFTVSAWSNSKRDKRGVETVANTFSAITTDDKYTKALVPKSALAKIDRVISAARTTHYKYTLPWANSGIRLLPTALYFTYQEKMVAHKNVFEELVKKFIDHYPQWIDYAERTKGDLFDRNEYIPAEQLAQRYAMTIDFMPIPESSDFRIDIAKQDIEDLRAEFDKTTQREMDKMAQYVKKLILNKIEYLRTIVVHLPSFRDDTVLIAEFVKNIRALNVADDYAITACCNKLDECTYTPNAIRSSHFVRNDMVEILDEATSVLHK